MQIVSYLSLSELEVPKLVPNAEVPSPATRSITGSKRSAENDLEQVISRLGGLQCKDWILVPLYFLLQ